MPAIRTSVNFIPSSILNSGPSLATGKVAKSWTQPCDTFYPIEPTERALYRTNDGKKVTPYQWDVYDFTRKIPCGNVTTYKTVSSAIGGSPRSVGGALRNNPFAPYVPCHRVIANNLFVGGFCGEWGRDAKTGTQFNRKLKLLEEEGLLFTQDGYLNDKDGKAIWQPGAQ
ncbi:DNA binding methylated-DNA--cysteine S-methyltransferase [Guyanagaster necrorhizus]|uniref:Methylated-DNA--protein-cysteine methyltransferase n=1 Tax=Guyanagaster necrorhizus TaxID=856835 RepID=A0A9P8AND7_9AGAR|nr:DNA binding methylated-DNA--cysteine S-methyltransferase [Guyanagaster necrorhizus MCA 3950]KAG7441636.1 DNA binding methylated-DNA--cysteine S-methyltransferase [Guyanagaster necrorhizus MCA 3950]